MNDKQSVSPPKANTSTPTTVITTCPPSKWVCDKCHSIAFNNYEAALRHEKVCTGRAATTSGSVASMRVKKSTLSRTKRKESSKTKKTQKRVDEVNKTLFVESKKKKNRNDEDLEEEECVSSDDEDNNDKDENVEIPITKPKRGHKGPAISSDDEEEDSEDDSSQDDNETTITSSSSSPHKLPPPTLQGSTLTFHLGPVRPHLICSLCDGYFRDPVTITECLHSFCKSCLLVALDHGIKSCPICQVNLSPDPKKKIMRDRILQEVVHQLFPFLEGEEEEEEKMFYQERGIRLQEQYRKEEEEEESGEGEKVLSSSRFGSQMRSQTLVARPSTRNVSAEAQVG